jgi:DNA repair protein RAD50
LDTKIADAQAPIDRLEQEHQQVQTELNNKIAEAQRLSQALNMSVDRLDNLNKTVERYLCFHLRLVNLLMHISSKLRPKQGCQSSQGLCGETRAGRERHRGIHGFD